MTDFQQVGFRFEKLSKAYGRHPAVKEIDLEVAPGAMVSLLGPSGCGKTTALRLLAGLERADSGVIRIGDRTVEGEGTFEPSDRRRIGMVFQDYALFPHMNALENVRFAIPKPERAGNRGHELLALVGLTGYQKRMPHAMSGGQQQRVALARALAMRPDIVLLDEPFSNLDAKLRTRVRNDVCAILREAGVTTLLVTHDQEEALSLSDRVSVMFQGRILQTDSPGELYRHPVDRRVATFLGDANFLPGTAASGVIDCEIGSLTTTEPCDGNVLCMIRPESIRLSQAANGPARVTRVEFFGHDQLVHLELDSGTKLQSRLLGPDVPLRPETRVSLRVEDPVVAYAES